MCNKVNNNLYFYLWGIKLLELVKTPLKVDFQLTEVTNVFWPLLILISGKVWIFQPQSQKLIWYFYFDAVNNFGILWCDVSSKKVRMYQQRTSYQWQVQIQNDIFEVNCSLFTNIALQTDVDDLSKTFSVNCLLEP